MSLQDLDVEQGTPSFIQNTGIPPFTDTEKFYSFLKNQISLVKKTSVSTAGKLRYVLTPASSFLGETQNFCSKDRYDEEKAPCGWLSHQGWRVLVSAAMAADWVSYWSNEDRVDLSRLIYVLDKFPWGMNIWWAVDSTSTFVVGYSYWYPISDSTFARFLVIFHNLS